MKIYNVRNTANNAEKGFLSIEKAIAYISRNGRNELDGEVSELTEERIGTAERKIVVKATKHSADSIYSFFGEQEDEVYMVSCSELKSYNSTQRMMNIINRAVNDFDFEVDEQDSLIDIYVAACDCITENVKYDRTEVCVMSNHHQHLEWADGMGHTYEGDGEFIGGRARDNHWLRKQNDGTFADIDWFEADTENDYVVCHYEFDSEGQLVRLVCQ